MLTRLRDRLADLLERPIVGRVLRLLGVAVVTAGVSGLGVYGVCNYHRFARVATVEVVGNHHASVVAVRHLADVHEGDALLLIDLNTVIRQVMRHPWVAEVEVERVYPGGLRVHVQEHEDVLLLSHAGHLYRVNPSGEVFLRARGDGLDRPVLTGLDDRLVEQYGPVARRIVLDALHILDLVGESGVIQPEDLSELHFDEALGFTLLLRNGGLLRFGFRDPAQQLLRLGVMARNGLDLSVPHHIDLDLDGLAVATPLSS